MPARSIRRAILALALAPLGVLAQEGMAGPLGIPMNRGASGTTWIPDAVSYPSRHAMLGAWDLMYRAIAFGEYDSKLVFFEDRSIFPKDVDVGMQFDGAGRIVRRTADAQRRAGTLTQDQRSVQPGGWVA